MADSVAEAAGAKAEQQHRQVLAVGAELAVALDDLHLAAVHQAGAAGGHPGFADDLGHFGAALDRFQDRRVELVDLLAQVVNVGDLIGFDRLGCHGELLVVWGFWSHPVSGLTQETSPGSGSGPRGSWKQLDHGHRWRVPVEKSTPVNEHVNECAIKGRASAKVSSCGGKLGRT